MANDLPALTRDRLTRVLGLPEHAPIEEIAKASRRLLARLERRRAAAGGAEEGAEKGAEENALRHEIADLEASCAYWANPPVERRRAPVFGARGGLLGSLIGLAVVLGLLFAHAAGLRLTRIEEAALPAIFEEKGTLLLEGGAPGATLRVFDADHQELIAKLPAEDAHVELSEGRYTLEVTREDCPDSWTQSVYFEPGATHRFEPVLCLGKGNLTVRSNVAGDRLQIDGIDVGATGAAAHEVGVGDHEVRVEKAGFEPFVGKVRIRPDQDMELKTELATKSSFRSVAAGQAAAQPAAPKPAIAPFDATQIEPFDLAQNKSDLGLPNGSSLGSKRLLRYDEGKREIGGSTAWHDRVSAEFLARFDSDRSGAIDRLEESEAIPCDVWREVERDFDTGGLGLSMAHYFGFDGSEWHPKALGFARSLRSAAYAKMKECGLAP